jgi:dihydrofolate reductase
LSRVTTPNTRLNREFEVEPLRDLKRTSIQDISIGGAELATAALQANLVDEFHVVVHPVIVGGGKPAFKTSLRRNFSLIESRRFDTGSVYVRYHIPSDSPS